MPTYEYECTRCGHRFQQLLTVSDMQLPLKDPCPACAENTITQLMSLTSIGDPLAIGKQRHGPSASIYHEKLECIDRTYGTNTKDQAKGR